MPNRKNDVSLCECAAGAAILGVFCGLDADGEPLIDFPANQHGPVAAISTVPLEELERAHEILILLTDGNEARPVIVGVSRSPFRNIGSVPGASASTADANTATTDPNPYALEPLSSPLDNSFTGAVIGTFSGLNSQHVPLVDFDGNPRGTPIPAHTCVPAKGRHAGTKVVLNFENGNPVKPIIVGLLERNEGAFHCEVQPDTAAGPVSRPLMVQNEGQRLTCEAQNEIVLRCGEASITLTRAGKVLIKGEYIVSRSSGVNCIKGGSVRIN